MQGELAALTDRWLDDMRADHDPLTVKSYGYYARHWPWKTVAELTDAAIHDYLRGELRVNHVRTVKKKKSAVAQLCFWLEEQGYMDRRPRIPPLPARAMGTRDTKRRHKLQAIPLTYEQAEAWVSSLPEWAWPGKDLSRRFRVKPRFIVAWHTALRPATLDEIRAPEDYHRGGRELIIRDEVDKARWGRVIALDEETRAALDSVCPDVGLIFGKHDHRGPLRRTARTTLPPDIRDRVTAYDLRHSRLTWMLEHTQNLAGVAYQSGHRRTDTLATFYVHPSRRAQESVLRDCARARQLELFDEDRR